ncbi:ribonuclease H-like domain-containing protein [Tanacetum coccineum]
MNSKESVDAEYASEINYLTFFDNQTPKRPYDDGRATSVEDRSVPSSRNNSTYTTLYVNNDFLYGDLVEDVYMTFPKGYENVDKTKVCKLTKSLYGLKQSPRQWNAKLTTSLAEHGFEQKNECGLCMTQRKYCLELLYEYGLLATRLVDIPLPENSVLCLKRLKMTSILMILQVIKKLVGKLIYLTNTRSDISYVVHCLSQHMHSHMQSHFKVALRVLRYLKRSPSCGIQFNKNSDLKLRDLADVDWVKCPMTKKSVTSFHVFLGQTLVSWKSKKHATLFKSSSEAKYRTIRIATNLVFHERTKHFELHVYFVREKVMTGVIKTVKIDTKMKLGMLDMFAGVMSSKEKGRIQSKKKKVQTEGG